ncbi:MAG: hypothetical protein NT076_01405 [Candidatus Pacearchaeota archaeon]|nr:hypothetical protein [Candidatus Pacearchaeota archaeon]
MPQENDSEILVVEDKPAEMDYAVELLEQKGIKSNRATTLVEGLRILKEKPHIPIVLTDVMYPVGEKIKDEFQRNVFYFALGYGLVSAGIALGALSKEIEDYAILVADGIADENPSGIVLGLYAMKQGKLPVFISSHEHHGSRTDGLVSLCRLGVFREDLFIEGINPKTGKKNWEKAVDDVAKGLKDKVYLNGLVRSMQDGEKAVRKGRGISALTELLAIPNRIDRLFNI